MQEIGAGRIAAASFLSALQTTVFRLHRLSCTERSKGSESRKKKPCKDPCTRARESTCKSRPFPPRPKAAARTAAAERAAAFVCSACTKNLGEGEAHALKAARDKEIRSCSLSFYFPSMSSLFPTEGLKIRARQGKAPSRVS